jgi:hypothetical protein
MTSTLAQNLTVCPALAGPSQNLPAREPQVARRRDDAIELDRHGLDRLRSRTGVDSLRDGRVAGRLGDGRQRAGEPQPQQLALLVRDGVKALGRRDRRPGLKRLVRALGVVFAHPLIQRGLRLEQ